MYLPPGNGWENYDQFPPAPVRRTAAGYQASGLTDGVLVPVLKSVFIGFCTGVLAGLLSWAFHASWSPWLAWLITWFAVMAFSFWRYAERGAWLIERITGADLNGDGVIGQPVQLPPALPAPEPDRIEITLVQNKGQIGEQGDIIDLPYPEKLPRFAEAVLDGRAIQSRLVGTGLFKRREYDTLIDACVAGGLLRWKNPEHHNIGFELTRAGRAVFRRFLPPPQEEDIQ